MSTQIPDPDTFHKHVRAALRHWHEPAGTNHDLLAYLLLVRRSRARTDGDGPDSTRRAATNRVLAAALDQLRQHQPDAAQLLRLRYQQLLVDREAALKLNISESHMYRQQRDAIVALAAILREKEEATRAETGRRLEAALAQQPYTQFVGQHDAQERLLPALIADGPPHTFVIAGLGGIGKTALADVLFRRIIHTFAFARLLWLDLPAADLDSQPLPPAQILTQVLRDVHRRLYDEEAIGNQARQLARIRDRLKQEKILLVVDNVETVVAVEQLLEHLQPLTDPAKLIITAREQPLGRQGIFIQTVGELDQADSLQLIRHEARGSGRDALAGADDATLKPIFDAVGGNPQALNLVVGMSDLYPLPVILRDLKKARLQDTAAMYKDIYWRVWHTLEPPAQHLLKAFVLAPATGAAAAQMQATSGLADTDFWQWLGQLTARSLVKVKGDTQERRYGIHRLTETFLQTEIIQWPPSL